MSMTTRYEPDSPATRAIRADGGCRPSRKLPARMQRLASAIRRLVLPCLLACAAVAVPAQEIDFGRLFSLAGKVGDAVREVPVEEELQIGAGMSAQLLGVSPLVADEALQRYVNRVGQWVAQHTERPELPWRFGVLDTPIVNAYAAPGGFIFITRGMFALLASESELAGVLAHEIGHVLRRHHLEAIREQAQTGIAADALALFSGSQGVNLDGVIDMGADLFTKGLSRDDELEADRVGVVLAARAGYEPWGLPRSLQALGKLRPDDDDFAQMFATHPPAADRLALLNKAMPATLTVYRAAPQGQKRFAAVHARLAR